MNKPSSEYWARFVDLPARVEHVIDWSSISTGEEGVSNWANALTIDAVLIDIPSGDVPQSVLLKRIRLYIVTVLFYIFRLYIFVGKFSKGA